MNIRKNNIQLAIVATLLVAATIGSIYQAHAAFAVTKFENCLTRQANHLHSLSYSSVVFCFNTQFKTVPHIH